MSWISRIVDTITGRKRGTDTNEVDSTEQEQRMIDWLHDGTSGLIEGKIKSNIKPYTGCKKPNIAPAPQPGRHIWIEVQHR